MIIAKGQNCLTVFGRILDYIQTLIGRHAYMSADSNKRLLMYLIMGITGNVGGAVARHLLQQGKQVRALVRDKGKAASWAQAGVELIEGTWENVEAMSAALQDVEGAYLMMPPVLAPSRDFREAKAVIACMTEALHNKLPAKVVALSSIGAEQESGLGAAYAVRLLEQSLNEMPFPVAFVRAGAFFENLLYGLQTGQNGELPVFYSPTSRQLPMVASEDIGTEVAILLMSEWQDRVCIELGSMLSPDDVAQQIGEVLGHDVQASAIPREAWAEALTQTGIPAESLWAYEDMLDRMNSGVIGFGTGQVQRKAGKTPLK
ncbi:TPA: NmrA family NAD(P)-binding protein [Escherichia coli]|nr:NmrA family NAD(P)-binding protein [Escherichia coli]